MTTFAKNLQRLLLSRYQGALKATQNHSAEFRQGFAAGYWKGVADVAVLSLAAVPSEEDFEEVHPKGSSWTH